MSKETYVVVTDDRHNPDQVLFMVDRNIEKSSFWSDNLDVVIQFNHQQTAAKVSGRLKFNNPRVVTFTEAQELAAKNTTFRMKESEWRVEGGSDGNFEN